VELSFPFRKVEATLKNDLLKFAILAELSRDANKKRNLIARDLGVTEGTLSKKVSAMVDDGVIRNFTVSIDYEKIGYPVNAVSLISLEDHQSKLSEVENYIKGQRSAVEYAPIVGDYDLFVRWLCRDNKDLTSTLSALVAIGDIQVKTIVLGERVVREPAILARDPRA
jgi:DNA-binding Lrp family transcriptional regulator